jgi:NAD(P)H-hydrate epimerase
MRALEQAAVDAGVLLDELMEQAGLAVAQEVWLTLGVVAGRRVLVLAGPGNNGGDALVAARHLAEWEADVVVYLFAPRDDARVGAVRDRDVPVFVASEDRGLASLRTAVDGAEIIVDGVLGTGRSRPIDGVMAELLDIVSAARARTLPPKVMAIDLPTGVDADSGRADPHTLTADATVTFGVAKVGLYTLPGSERAGKVQVVDIGIPKGADAAISTELLSTSWVRERLPDRPAGANKGTFGKALVVAGSRNYLGAARLTAEACYRAGAGLVTIACPASVQAIIAPSIAEATWLPLDDEDGALSDEATNEIVAALAGYDVLVIGPGLSLGGDVSKVVPAVLSRVPANVRGCVVDADGLNALAGTDSWPNSVTSPLILTPHPGEMARLLQSTVGDVQDGRLRAAVDAAVRWRHTVVLKGAHTIVAAADGRAAVSPHANPLLATAGTGDVLAGTIAGLLAQGLEAFEAAACGVYVHALAAEEIGDQYAGRGMLASDLLPAIPQAMRTIVHGKAVRSGPMPGLGDFAGLGGFAGGGTDAGGGLRPPGFP